MWNVSSRRISYLYEAVHPVQANSDYTRVIRYDAWNDWCYLWTQSSLQVPCQQGYTCNSEYSFFIREFEYDTDDAAVCPNEGEHDCRKYCRDGTNCIIVDKNKRLVQAYAPWSEYHDGWKNPILNLSWIEDTKPAKGFVLHMCSGADLSAPDTCIGAASVATVAKAVLAFAALVALLI